MLRLPSERAWREIKRVQHESICQPPRHCPGWSAPSGADQRPARPSPRQPEARAGGCEQKPQRGSRDASMAARPGPGAPPGLRMRCGNSRSGAGGAVELSLCRHRADEHGASALSLPFLPSSPFPSPRPSVLSLLPLSPAAWRPRRTPASGQWPSAKRCPASSAFTQEVAAAPARPLPGSAGRSPGRNTSAWRSHARGVHGDELSLEG